MALIARFNDPKKEKDAAQHLKEYMGAEIVEINDSLLLTPVAERVKFCLDRLEKENLLQHGYDYIWIMLYLNEQNDNQLFFYSVKSYYKFIHDYMGHHKVAKVSTLSDYAKYKSGKFPNWTFSDPKADTTESMRRINLVKRFINIYYAIAA